MPGLPHIEIELGHKILIVPGQLTLSIKITFSLLSKFFSRFYFMGISILVILLHT